MTFETWQKRKILNPRLLRRQLPVCGTEIDTLLTQILATHFPGKNLTTPAVFFGYTPTLAHIEEISGDRPAAIWFHHSLNDQNTPGYVFALILKHELLHTQIRPREVDGKWSAHPPEFWQEENRIAKTEKHLAWKWIRENLGEALKHDAENECIWVNNRRMKELLRRRHYTLDDLMRHHSGFDASSEKPQFGYRKEFLDRIKR